VRIHKPPVQIQPTPWKEAIQSAAAAVKAFRDQGNSEGTGNEKHAAKTHTDIAAIPL
jgi:hypothetical protein